MNTIKRAALTTLYLAVLAGLGTVALGCASAAFLRAPAPTKTVGPEAEPAPSGEPAMGSSGQAG